MADFKINDVYDASQELSFYDVLGIVQKYFSENYPDLFVQNTNEIYEPIIGETKKKKIKSAIEGFVRQRKIKVKDMPFADEVCEKLYQEMAEYSILTKYLVDEADQLEEINVNAWNDVELIYSNGDIKKGDSFFNIEHARNIMKRLVTLSGSNIDDAMPMAEGSLTNNIRIVVLQSPIVDDNVGVACSIRLLKPQKSSADFFISNGTVAPDELEFLELAIRNGISTVFVGATSSGKTTLMNYLLTTTSDKRRIVTIEHNARELSLVKTDENGNIVNNVVHTLTRPHENPQQNISQEDLVVKALRLDPDIICVGEMRDSEAYAAQEASLTGHTVVSSIHADGISATHFRIAMLALKRYPIDLQLEMIQAAMAFPLIVFVAKMEDNSRKIMEIAECCVDEDENGQMKRSYNTLYRYNIEKNETHGEKTIITGHHERCGVPSQHMLSIMKLNGATNAEIARVGRPLESDEK